MSSLANKYTDTIFRPDNAGEIIESLNTNNIMLGEANLYDLMDVDFLNDNIEEGLVTVSSCGGLTNYKYSKITPPYRLWNEVTLRTRGLVVDENYTIVARGFNKFFNLSELPAYGIDVDVNERGIIMDKLDGSLGLVYRYGGEWRVSTAGGFASEQAIHATKLFNERYADTPCVPGLTLLVEIIYPENRIVSNYGDLDDVVLLGGADLNGNWVHPDEIVFPGRKVAHYTGTIKEALSVPDPEDGTEGFVIKLDSGLLVKVKYPSYLVMHKARFNLTRKSVLATLRDNSYAEYLMLLPDEFQDEANSYRDDILKAYDAISSNLAAIGEQVPVGGRKERAIWVNMNVAPTYRRLAMQAFVAGVDPAEQIWRMIENTL